MKTKEDSSLSNAQQTIIQCPGCQTKFAVETSAISQLDFPRFHCSRCDNVFGLDQSSKFQPQMVQEKPENIYESQEAAHDEPATAHQDELQEEPVVADPEEPTFAMDTFHDAMEETIEDETPEFEIDNPPVARTTNSPIAHSSVAASPITPSYTEELPTEPAPSSSLYRGLEIPKQYDSTITPAAPRETESVEVAPATTSRREKKNDPLKDQMELQFSSTHFTKPTPQPEAAIPSPAANPYKSIAETLAKERAEVYSAKASARKEATEHSPNGIGSIAKITPPAADADYPQLFDNAFIKDGELGRFSLGGGRISGSTLFFMAPIVAVLVCLALLGSYLKNNLNAGTSFASLLFSPPAKVAPAGLTIKNPKYKKVTLESGEDVRLISGTLVNSSSESFRDVKLEGLAFDDAGHPLTKVKVDAGSSLAKSRIKSMSVDMIKTMQTTTASKRYELKPGDSQDFEMALVDDASTRARYFSARIYSVK